MHTVEVLHANQRRSLLPALLSPPLALALPLAGGLFFSLPLPLMFSSVYANIYVPSFTLTHSHSLSHTHLSFSPSLPLSTRARILSLSLQYGQPVLTIAREKKLIEISKILMEAGALEDLKLEKIEDE